MNLVPAEDFAHRFRTFRYTAFRLETLQTYRGSGEDDWIAAFHAGDRTPPPDPAADAWEAMLAANRAAGKRMQRVHVVVEPLSDYLRFELTWMYAPNAAAGEDVRIIDATHDWPDGVPRQDFHLFDSSDLYAAHYAADGLWLGVEQVTDPVLIVAACRARDAALHHSVPWKTFIAARPELAARLPFAVRV